MREHHHKHKKRILHFFYLFSESSQFLLTNSHNFVVKNLLEGSTCTLPIDQFAKNKESLKSSSYLMGL